MRFFKLEKKPGPGEPERWTGLLVEEAEAVRDLAVGESAVLTVSMGVGFRGVRFKAPSPSESEATEAEDAATPEGTFAFAVFG